MKNLWLKTRKREHAYYVTGNISTGEVWRVLKVYSDPRKPCARVLLDYEAGHSGFFSETRDAYAKDVPGLIEAWTHAHYSPTRAVKS